MLATVAQGFVDGVVGLSDFPSAQKITFQRKEFKVSLREASAGNIKAKAHKAALLRTLCWLHVCVAQFPDRVVLAANGFRAKWEG